MFCGTCCSGVKSEFDCMKKVVNDKRVTGVIKVGLCQIA